MFQFTRLKGSASGRINYKESAHCQSGIVKNSQIISELANKDTTYFYENNHTTNSDGIVTANEGAFFRHEVCRVLPAHSLERVLEATKEKRRKSYVH